MHAYYNETSNGARYEVRVKIDNMNQFPAKGKFARTELASSPKPDRRYVTKYFFRNYVPFLCFSKTYNVDSPPRINTHCTRYPLHGVQAEKKTQMLQLLIKCFEFFEITRFRFVHVKYHIFVLLSWNLFKHLITSTPIPPIPKNSK